MIVLDACVLIAHLDASDVHHSRATGLLLDAADEPFAASAITLAEVLVGPARSGKLDAVQAALRTLDVQVLPLGTDSPARLAVIRATTRLRMPDCCVVLAVQDAEASLATFDNRLGDAAAHLGIDVRH
ncbi:type II toxin-antitoxin system VapC family toxin [Angustibacter sp. McL0619]|uniref:type II toxin-antitoxin system VapC family toxin n=1 Tax=Angustibacter sp. McL0619 TaxID=3415676 RepID=UPI003CEAC050